MRDTLAALLLVAAVYGGAAGAVFAVVAGSGGAGPASEEPVGDAGDSAAIVETSAWSGHAWERRGSALPVSPLSVLACAAS